MVALVAAVHDHFRSAVENIPHWKAEMQTGAGAKEVVAQQL
jgi:hypothetical protein